ncbi:hypothetical protein ABKV19_020996 [Rosa sericea]
MAALNPNRPGFGVFQWRPTPASPLSGTFLSTLCGFSSAMQRRLSSANTPPKQPFYQNGSLDHEPEPSHGDSRRRSGLQCWGVEAVQRGFAGQVTSGRIRPSRARLKDAGLELQGMSRSGGLFQPWQGQFLCTQSKATMWGRLLVAEMAVWRRFPIWQRRWTGIGVATLVGMARSRRTTSTDVRWIRSARAVVVRSAEVEASGMAAGQLCSRPGCTSHAHWRKLKVQLVVCAGVQAVACIIVDRVQAAAEAVAMTGFGAEEGVPRSIGRPTNWRPKSLLWPRSDEWPKSDWEHWVSQLFGIVSWIMAHLRTEMRDPNSLRFRIWDPGGLIHSSVYARSMQHWSLPDLPALTVMGKEKSNFSDDEELFYHGICTPADHNNDNNSTGSDSGLSLEKLNLQPRKKLLVLSLNGLLLYRVYRKNKAKFPTTRDPDARFASQLVFEGPFAAEFVEFCLERFEVAVWSCAQERKVKGVLDCVMGWRKRKKLIAIFDQDHCTDSEPISMEDKEMPLFLKKLKDLWKYLDGKYSESDTLLIDDQPYKALLNPPYTGIFLESYNPNNASDNALDPKGELGVYLDDLAAADNVQVYVKKNPFGVPRVSSGHPDWNFYSAVIRRLKGESEKASTSQQLDS